MLRHQEFLIDDIMPCREVHLLAGPSGAGKTTFVVQMLKAMKLGASMWGHDTHVPTDGIAYASCDRSRESVLRMSDRHEVQPTEWNNFKIEFNSSVGSQIDNCCRNVKRMYPATKLFVIDGLATLIPDGKLSDYISVARFLIECRTLAEELDFTILGVVHATKVRDGEHFPNPRQRIYGSVAWAGFSDCVMVLDLQKPEDSNCTQRILHVLPRDAAAFMLRYDMNVDGHLEVMLDDAESDLVDFLDREFDTLALGSERFKRDWVQFGRGLPVPISERTVERWLARMIDEGKLERIKQGRMVSYRRVGEA